MLMNCALRTMRFLALGMVRVYPVAPPKREGTCIGHNKVQAQQVTQGSDDVEAEWWQRAPHYEYMNTDIFTRPPPPVRACHSWLIPALVVAAGLVVTAVVWLQTQTCS